MTISPSPRRAAGRRDRRAVPVGSTLLRRLGREGGGDQGCQRWRLADPAGGVSGAAGLLVLARAHVFGPTGLGARARQPLLERDGALWAGSVPAFASGSR